MVGDIIWDTREYAAEMLRWNPHLSHHEAQSPGFCGDLIATTIKDHQDNALITLPDILFGYFGVEIGDLLDYLVVAVEEWVAEIYRRTEDVMMEFDGFIIDSITQINPTLLRIRICGLYYSWDDYAPNPLVDGQRKW